LLILIALGELDGRLYSFLGSQRKLI